MGSCPLKVVGTNDGDLRKLSFLSDLATPVLRFVAEKLKPGRHYRDERVFTGGYAPDTLYLIESGQVEIALTWVAKEEVLAYLTPGDFFGEMCCSWGIGVRRRYGLFSIPSFGHSRKLALLNFSSSIPLWLQPSFAN